MFGDGLSDLVSNYLVLMVVLGLVVIWLVLSILIGILTGWFTLMTAYPDRIERAVAKRTRAPAVMGGASLKGMLRIEVCASGLRFGMNRLFAPFSRDFLVPWSEIEIEQKHSYLPHPRAMLLLGKARRKVTLSPEFMAALMREGASVWPERLVLPAESDHQFARRLFKQWLVATLIATVLLTVLPSVLMDIPTDDGLLALGLAIPAIAIGVSYLFTYYRYRTGR